MRSLLIAIAIAAVAGAAHAQSRGSRGSSYSHTYGSAYGSHSYGGYGYGTGSNPSSQYNSGYYRNNGTYVRPHYSTTPNGTQMDNYGTRGNYNPYTGTYGTRTPRY